MSQLFEEVYDEETGEYFLVPVDEFEQESEEEMEFRTASDVWRATMSEREGDDFVLDQAFGGD